MEHLSSGLKGILVIPSLIDVDFTGNIQVVAYTLHPPLHIPKGSQIAQLVPLENLTAQVCGTPNTGRPQRGDAGFGSTEVVCLTLDMKKRPEKQVSITNGHNAIQFKALLDTGADITIVSSEVWPWQWPVRPSDSGVDGVGGVSLVYISTQPITTELDRTRCITHIESSLDSGTHLPSPSKVRWAPNQHLKVLITRFVFRTLRSCVVTLCPASYMNMAFPCHLPVEMGRKFLYVLGNDQTQPLFKACKTQPGSALALGPMLDNGQSLALLNGGNHSNSLTQVKVTSQGGKRQVRGGC